jgi:hypothetical protein
MKIITQAMMDEQKLSPLAQLKVFVYTLVMIPAAVVLHTVSAIAGALFTIVMIPTTMYDIVYKIEKAKLVINEKASNGTL